MRTLVLRKNPIVIVRNFIALHFAAVSLYYLASTVAHYARIWRGLPLVHTIPFPLAQIVFIFLAEIVMVLYIFFLWHRETIRLEAGRLIQAEGILVRRRVVISLNQVASATYYQGIFGRLANFGSVSLVDSRGSILIKLAYMSEPKELSASLTGWQAQADDNEPLRLILAAESDKLERKSTFRWDVKTKTVSKSLEKAAVKTIAAFLNSGGGQVLLGVDDKGQAVGVEQDIATLTRKDIDGLENHFSNVLSAMVGPAFRQHVTFKPFTYEGKTCILLSVSPAHQPAFVSEEGREEFFVRVGNSTASLKMSEANKYISSNFS